jgi:hypothetical protein
MEAGNRRKFSREFKVEAVRMGIRVPGPYLTLQCSLVIATYSSQT